MKKQGWKVGIAGEDSHRQTKGLNMRSNSKSIRWLNFIAAVAICIQCLIAGQAQAKPRPAIPPLPERYLNHWDFDNTNMLAPTWTNTFHENIGLADSWSEYALSMEGNQPALFAIPGIDATGHTNITPLAGSIRFWFKPSWTSGAIGNAGQKFDGRLFEAASWTANQSISWCSLQFGANGESISFVAQSGDDQVELFRTPIQWQADQWHQVALIYAPQGTWLVLDGQFIAQGTTAALTPLASNRGVFGICIGSAASGRNLAQGQFEELTTFDYPLGALEVSWNYSALAPTVALGAITPEEEAARVQQSLARRAARLARESQIASGGQVVMALSGPPSPGDGDWGDDTNVVSLTEAFSGTGLKLIMPGTDGSNFTATVTNGSSGLRYDLFSSTNLAGNSVTNSTWTWLRQVTNMQTFTLSSQLSTNNFYILGTPQDSDGDGVTDAFESLVHQHLWIFDPYGDLDGDGTLNYKDARPFDPSIGILNISIDDPISGSTLY
jgi:hypothetical protein